ncbi:myosin-binding protein 3-like isoform X1 [Lycium ferocissimum]|uniref:myosin-binding protein 3-like isoform X1 n=1 Tax=Lycium ferocissimum TaxID=112874 RepID=UPI0028158869|nr:myosin-binding protein 3-like isoform X1 [Lycium ferocissimum]XP_059308818.1 myosin-binding protein 3-like isoform X1 [Lycium ferocissimum]
MAANKFATMLHKNTNKITLILIYAILEWTLIILLLLNSLFSYMIIKFADYFGLKPPCPLCSRVDHLFDHQKTKTLNKNHLCEAHNTEIAKLGFCSNHQKLVESQDMCEDCLSSQPDFRGVSEDLALFELIKNGKEVNVENCEVSLKCSCCGVNLERKFSTTTNYILIKPCFDDLGYAQKGNLVVESVDDENKCDDLDKERSDLAIESCRNEEKISLSDDLNKERSDFSINSCGNEEKNDLSDDLDKERSDIAIESFGNEEKINLCDDLDKERSDFAIESSGNEEKTSLCDDLDKERSDFVIESCGNEEKTNLSDDLVVEGVTDCIEENCRERIMKDQAVQVCLTDDLSFEFSPQHLDFVIECSGHKLIPIELIDSTTEDDHRKNQETDENRQKNDDEVSLDTMEQVNEEVEVVVENKVAEVEEETIVSFLDSMKMKKDENGLVLNEQFDNIQLHQGPSRDNVQIVAESVREEEGLDVSPVSEEVSQMAPINETDAEVSIGNEIPDMDLSDEIPCQVALDTCTHEEPSTSFAHFHEVDRHGPEEDQEKLLELKLVSVEFDERVMDNQSSISSKLNEIEEDKVPETPTSIDSFQQLHKKLLLLEKKDFGTESLDGSVVSELEGGDTVSTIEHLKSALTAERKALHALYTELEEERSASAVAANQTIAMINKLQEEKSAMQMEALQYQRMMEEQSEYDQEALQLLNELMVKREKEKQELEKELEVCRKRLLEYEAKEKTTRMLKSRSKDSSARSGFSSATEDSEELSIDLNKEVKEDESFYGHQECEDDKVRVDAVLELEESFVDFEEERMSILEQLKMLEEKLITIDDEDVRPMEDSYRENGDHKEEISHLNGEINDRANCFLSEMNGKLIVNAEGKGLLPLFDDAMSDENGDVMLNGHENGFHSDVDNKKLDVEEELDHLHERLQALEADREFLKNCVSSLKKGDKGMDLLHEILQHLRDLKNVDLRERSSCNGLIL